MIRTYTELATIDEFEDRFEYLKTSSEVGAETFGFERWLNQRFYTSPEWKTVRRDVLARDLGCDLGVEGHEIYDVVFVHHMNPITPQQVSDRDPDILNPEYLICVSRPTHNAIHFGGIESIPKPFVERRPNDTKLW